MIADAWFHVETEQVIHAGVVESEQVIHAGVVESEQVVHAGVVESEQVIPAGVVESEQARHLTRRREFAPRNLLSRRSNDSNDNAHTR